MQTDLQSQWNILSSLYSLNSLNNSNHQKISPQFAFLTTSSHHHYLITFLLLSKPSENVKLKWKIVTWRLMTMFKKREIPKKSILRMIKFVALQRITNECKWRVEIKKKEINLGCEFCVIDASNERNVSTGCNKISTILLLNDIKKHWITNAISSHYFFYPSL